MSLDLRQELNEMIANSPQKGKRWRSFRSLSEDRVEHIYLRAKAGERVSKIAFEENVSVSTVYDIKNRKTHKELIDRLEAQTYERISATHSIPYNEIIGRDDDGDELRRAGQDSGHIDGRN